MKTYFFILCVFISTLLHAQEEGDSLYKRCPVFITDTVSNNNFFIEQRPATVKVYRSKGELTIVVEQKEQFFSIFFTVKNLSNGEYKISLNPRKSNQIAAKYSFRSDDQVSYVTVSSGVLEASFDEAKQHWRIRLNGMIANSVGRSVSYYRARTDFYIKK